MGGLKQAKFKLFSPSAKFLPLLAVAVFALTQTGCAKDSSSQAKYPKPADQATQQTKTSIRDTGSPYIQFLGAAQMVGGSCYLIDTGKTRFLVDFGLFYGADHQEKNRVIDFDPASIDFVLLTHAHIDHSGRIPMLYARGFRGKVFGTDATKSIAGVMLEMSLRVGEEPGVSIYGWKDYGNAMNNFVSVPYDHVTGITDDVSVRFRDAGHILGSSIIELWIRTKGGTVKVVAAGDMGPGSTPLLRDPAVVPDGDYFLVESTYGSSRRGNQDYRAFGRDIQSTLNEGGSVLAPAFVLEKTQKLIYVIGQLKREGIVAKDVPVYADSATGHEITKIYRKYTQYYNADAASILSETGDPLSFPFLFEVSGKTALKQHDSGRSGPAVYLTSSGMLDHANAPKHLEKMIENPKNLLAIVGWQAPDSLGRKLQDGATRVEIPIEDNIEGKIQTAYVEKPVKIKVRKYSSFSSHADGCYTLKWLSHVPKSKEVYVVHGEMESTIALRNAITAKLGFKAVAPSLGDKMYIGPDKADHFKKQSGVLCGDASESDDLKSMADQ